MDLTRLGFDGWFQEKSRALVGPDFAVARVTRVDRDRYLVRNEQGEVQAEPTGKLLFSADSGQDLPCVGDWVVVQYHNDGALAIIHDVIPRKSFLRRKSPGGRVEYQMIAANIDAAFIMQSCDLNFNVRRLERYLVMARDGHVEPVILLSKSDLLTAEELQSVIADIRQENIDARIIAFSGLTEEGAAPVRQALQTGKTYCLIGSSGVGKTTLVNQLLGSEVFGTQPVREQDDRGRHTTSRRELVVLDNGALLIDTPGMRELGLMAAGESIDESFAEIRELAEQCRFKDCTHTVEVDCAVLGAINDGALTEERYRAYMKLVKESRFHEMSYAERRRKDKKFGRMFKTAIEEIRKRKPI